MKIIYIANCYIGWGSNGNKRISLYRRKSLEDWQFQKGAQWWAVQMKWELGCWFLLRYWLKLSLAFLDEENNEDINSTKSHHINEINTKENKRRLTHLFMSWTVRVSMVLLGNGATWARKGNDDNLVHCK